MKKELFMFLGLFIFLALGTHFKEWMSYPLQHIAALPNSGAYGLGAFHPLIFTLLVYVIFVILRFLVRATKRIVTK